MVDYDFYVNHYLGSAIPEQAFPEMAARAGDALEQLRHRYQVTGEQVQIQLALCALADALYQEKSLKNGISAATVGGVSVRYENRKPLRKRLMEAAGIYLDIYRGAGV